MLQGHLVVGLRKKMNYRRKPSKRGLKRDSDQPYRQKKPQMPTLSDVPIGVGEDEASHDRHVKLLKKECKKVTPSKAICLELMKRIHGFRQQMIKENKPTIDHILAVYPAFRYTNEVGYSILLSHYCSMSIHFIL